MNAPEKSTKISHEIEHCLQFPDKNMGLFQALGVLYKDAQSHVTEVNGLEVALNPF